MSQKKTLKGKNLSTAKYKTKANLVWGFTISFFAAGLIGSAVLAGYSGFVHNKIFAEQVRDNLEEVVRISTNNVEIFLQGKKGRVIDFASDGFIKNSLKDLQENNSEEIMRELSEHLINNKIVVDESFFEVFVLDAYGLVVGTTDAKDAIGKDLSQDLIFLEGKKASYIKESFYDKEFSRNSIAISAPILRKGESVGVIVIKMSLNDLIRIVTDAGEFNKYGEIYIIDNDSIMLTPSKFLRGENKGILTQKVDTENSKDCIEGIKISGNNKKALKKHGLGIASFLDYRGEEVIGTHKHILGTKWCLLAEIDEEKVLTAPQKDFINKQIVILSIVVFILTIIGFFVGKFFDKKHYNLALRNFKKIP